MSKNYKHKLETNIRTRKSRPYHLCCSERKNSYSWIGIGESAFSLDTPGVYFSEMRSARKAHQYMRQKENKGARLQLKSELKQLLTEELQ